MAWRMIQQPDGLYAAFSEVVDDFIMFDATREQALEFCKEKSGLAVAIVKVSAAERWPGRWEEALQIIQVIHGYQDPDPRIRHRQVGIQA